LLIIPPSRELQRTAPPSPSTEKALKANTNSKHTNRYGHFVMPPNAKTTGRPAGFALGFLDGKTARLAKGWPNGQ
jgi:hypothetical protein